MTLDSSSPLKTVLPATARLPVTPGGRMSRRPREAKSLPVQSMEDTAGHYVHVRKHSPRRPETTNLIRRASHPTGKKLISPVYREKRMTHKVPVSISTDLGLHYPTPEPNIDFLQAAETNIASTEKEAASASKATNGATEIAQSPDKVNASSAVPASKVPGSKSEHSNASHPQWGNTLSGMRTNRRFSVPVTTLEKQLEEALTLTSQQHQNDKNEAELIEEQGEKMSFSSAMLNSPTRGGGAGVARETKRGERELRSLYHNCIHERRLRSACHDLEKRSYAGIMVHKNLKQQISRQHQQLLKRSPTTDDWLSERKYHTATLQERERESISRRFSRRVRNFRAPKELQERVSNIRSAAMFQAGLLDHAHPTPTSPAEAVYMLRRVAAAASGAVARRSDLGLGDDRRGSDDHYHHHQPSIHHHHIPNHHASSEPPHKSMNHHPRRESALEREMALEAALLQNIPPPRTADAGMMGYDDQSRRSLTAADVKTMRSVLQGGGAGLYNTLPSNFSPKELNGEGGLSGQRSEERQDGLSEGDHDSGLKKEEIDDDDSDASGNNNFNDLDQMSSDSDDDDDEEDGDDDAFEKENKDA